MKFELDIVKRMRTGAGEFFLSTRFASSDRALVLFGPSGSGKTLTLQAIAGLLTPDKGRIAVNKDVLFDSESGINVPARSRGVGYVCQDYALFPHKTVRENVAFGLKPLFGKIPEQEAERVDALLELFGLTSLAGARPWSLSGGQRQRTALARALATRPRILLLDEPFSALDQPLRVRMREELSRILKTFDIPVIMVTHDTDEAESFADSVIVYDQGNVVGVHAPADIRDAGANVAGTVCNRVARTCDIQ